MYVILENAKEYATVAKERNPKIHIEYVIQAEINDTKLSLVMLNCLMFAQFQHCPERTRQTFSC